MEMVVPDEVRDLLASFKLAPDLILDLWAYIDEDIPNTYDILRGNRPADFLHEGFYAAQTFWVGIVRHTFHLWVDDSSATGRLFLRDIQHDIGDPDQE